MHPLFNDTPAYTGDDGVDIPLGTPGSNYHASTEFDGWSYAQLHDARDPTLRIIGSYASRRPSTDFVDGFGTLSVHEVKTDPRPKKNLAYISHYNAGMRVVAFGPSGMTEVGHYIAEGGNHIWGSFPVCAATCWYGGPSRPDRS